MKSGPPAVVYTSRRGPAPIRHGACTQPQAGRSRRLRLRRLRRAPRTPEAATSRSKAALRSRASPGDPGLRRARDWRVAAARLLCSYRPSTRGLASASAQAAALEPRRRRGGGPGRLGKTAAAEQSAADCWRSSRSDGRRPWRSSSSPPRHLPRTIARSSRMSREAYLGRGTMWVSPSANAPSRLSTLTGGARTTQATTKLNLQKTFLGTLYGPGNGARVLHFVEVS